MERDDIEMSCTGCGESGGRAGPLGTCRDCGGILTADYRIEEMSEGAEAFDGTGIWRYSKLLPIDPKGIPISLGEGGTTLLRAQRLGEILGMGKLYLKNETTNPTGCFVDRGTALEITFAQHSEYGSVACCYSGNLAASVAAYSARAGISSQAFLPPNVDMGRLYQIVAYGAKIVTIDSQEEADAAMLELGDDWYSITNHSPFFLEGIKTTGLEIAEQLEWRAPDRIILAIGSGAHFAMIWKGLKELERMGLVDASKTRMTGVQMKGFSPIVDQISGNSSESSIEGKRASLAREIAVQHPQMTDRVINAIRESNGTAIAVDEKEIIDAVQLLAQAEGIFAEPSAAATVAGLRRLLNNNEIDRGDRTVCVITGTGLKEPITSQKALRRAASARRIAQRMEKRIRNLDIGSSKKIIMELIGTGSGYGYGIWRQLREEKNIEISVVSVYQHLAELETAGLVKKERIERSPARRKRVIYRLTPRGHKFLSNEMED